MSDSNTTSEPNINIDLFGWDTSFGVSFDQVNKDIVQQKSSPQSFSKGEEGKDGSISGDWSDWSLTLNGDGKNINIKCPIKKGHYHALLPQNHGKSVDLGSNGENWFEVQVRLEAFDSSQNWYDKTSTKGSGQTKDYKVKSSGGTSESPIVSIYGRSFDASQAPFNTLDNSEAELAICEAAFKGYFTTNLDKFNNIFSTFILNAKADVGNFQWLKPTTTDYAVETRDTMEKSIFSVLCMTENRPAPSSTEVTDPRLLESANASSVFAIAQKRFLEKWLKPGVALANAGTDLNDYFLYSDTLITNNKPLVFKNRVENHRKEPTDLKVPQGNFKIGIFDTQVTVRFDGASFEYDNGITCELNYVDYYKLSLLPGDGHNALHVSPINNLPDIQISMQVADWRQKRDLWIEIGVSIAASVAGALLGPAIGPVLGRAFSAAADSAVGRAITAGARAAVVSITEIIEQVAASRIGQIISEGVNVAITTLGDIANQIGALSVGSRTLGELASDLAAYIATKALSVGQFFMANRYLIIGGIVGGATGVLLGDIPKIITANEKADIPNMASLNAFSDNAVGAIKWPSGVFQLSSAQLAGVLLLGGSLV